MNIFWEFEYRLSLIKSKSLSFHEFILIYSIALERNFGEVVRVLTILERKASTDGHERGGGESRRRAKRARKREGDGER